MNVFLIFFMVLELLFGAWLIVAGLELRKFKSVKKELANYKKSSKNHSFTKDWFLGWKFGYGRWASKMVIRALDDGNAARFYRASGVFFLFASPIFFLAPFFQLRLLFL